MLDGGAAGSSPSSGTGGGAGTVSGEAGHPSGGDAGAPPDPSGGEAGEDSGVEGGGPGSPTIKSGKVDLLLVVDNSISMGDKQAPLAKSVPALVARLVDPWCVGGSEATRPLDDGSCPNGTERETRCRP